MPIWSGKRVAKFVITPPKIKVNANGVDIGVSEIWLIPQDSIATLDGKTRVNDPEKIKILPKQDNFYHLEPGVYDIRLANKIIMPQNAIGRLYPRSSLNRLGMVKSQTAIWEPSYKGFGTQTVFIPIKGFKIHKDELWFQFVLEDCEVSNIKYEGHWQGEKPQ